MSEKTVGLKVLSFNLGPASTKAVEKLFSSPHTVVQLSYDLDKLSDAPPDPNPNFIFCGKPQKGVSVIEVSQVLRTHYTNNLIYYTSEESVGFNRANFQKNGFTDAFLLPFEVASFNEIIADRMAEQGKGVLKTYRAVRLIDVKPDTVLDFDTYIFLPANKKHVRYTKSGQGLNQDQYSKLSQHQVSSMHISRDQMKHFYEYTAAQLRDIQGAPISETEKQEKLQTAVRNLLIGIFDDKADTGFDAGREVISDCNQIVKSYIMGFVGSGKNEWYSKILQMAEGGAGVYSHLSNVSTFSALFSMGLGIGDPEEMALAGLLYDIGLIKIPSEILQKTESERTPEETQIYYRHPLYSVEIIKARRLIVSEKLLGIVLQHHEKYSGGGHPNKLEYGKMLPEAQVLALAEEFNGLIQVKEGSVRLNPLEAIKKILSECELDSAKAKYDVKIIRKLVNMFSVN